MIVSEERVESAKACLVGWLDDLEKHAHEIVEAHWARVREEEGKRSGWQHKSQLQLRCLRRGNTLIAEWVKIRWVGSMARGTRTGLREPLRKGRGPSYRLETLTRLSRDWEKTIVEETEKRLSEIRRQWGHITKALLYLRFASGETGKKKSIKNKEVSNG
ncbi:conjugative transfer protein MobI(A/C) [Pelomicrobium methylotrophicum]|uniref:Uncharacterized protein n=1 Tax=Pelomicrobium methylotrophicum TaxID=2602750 RepID=A0A5C7ESK5_9PROT|nr:conjugative transfer protein MobI(A/C) [Pelomicrobium methylotrophicum]TXF11184.1 hypothetical protein FR698_11760 [Pelomicrobium methylotrophicum]